MFSIIISYMVNNKLKIFSPTVFNNHAFVMTMKVNFSNKKQYN